MKRFEAIATHLGMDISELVDYRYHMGWKTADQPVWSVNDNYYTVTRLNLKPKKNHEWSWTKVKDEHIESQGFQIWIKS